MKGNLPSPHKVVWSVDGKELFYVPRFAEFESVPVTFQPTSFFGQAVTVPRPFNPGGPNNVGMFDLMPNGKFRRTDSAGSNIRITPSSTEYSGRPQLVRGTSGARAGTLIQETGVHYFVVNRDLTRSMATCNTALMSAILCKPTDTRAA